MDTIRRETPPLTPTNYIQHSDDIQAFLAVPDSEPGHLTKIEAIIGASLVSTKLSRSNMKEDLRAAVKSFVIKAMDTGFAHEYDTSFYASLGQKVNHTEGTGSDAKDLYLQPSRTDEAHNRQKSLMAIKALTVDDLATGDTLDLLGQEGVFARCDIPQNTCIGAFNGVFLTCQEDIQKHKALSNMAGISEHKYNMRDSEARYDRHNIFNNASLLVGRGVLSKLNAALDVSGQQAVIDSSGHSSSTKHNTRIERVATVMDGREVIVSMLFTRKPIKAGDELRIPYAIP